MSQSYIGIDPKLYSFLCHPNIALPTRPYTYIRSYCASPPLHYSYLLASKIGGFRLRRPKEESASGEDMVLRNGLFMGSAGENGNYLEAWKTYIIFATQISKHGVVVQLVRIPACHAGGRGFESRPYRQRREHSESRALFLYRCLSHLITLDAIYSKYIVASYSH